MSFINKKETSIQLALVNFISKEGIQTIIQYWIRVLKIKLGWIHNFDKLVVNYASVFMFETFRSSSKLLTIFYGHKNWVKSIDYAAFNNCQFLCSGSNDKTIRVWDIENSKQIQLLKGHSNSTNCVKFSSYHYHNYRQNVVCSSSEDKTIRFWDIKDNQQLKIFNEHTGSVYMVDIYALDHLTELFVYGMLKHQNHYMFSMDMKVVFCVLVFHHYKAIITMIIIKVIILV
ncbi:F-box and wd40 domain protein [Reticulomyxa filosa]|uniref:F-box and wd40 domain protein n=1 Tax=Reticulomyxa filosa TaxID=46433 RepID=X6PBS5_RETFI|nr:F-box and wd40 domain protein [Reticulomyxa filosa]|eukprot:ETO35127.1 F-box and wd40 domain protein [Reticulomyxa filosa]